MREARRWGYVRFNATGVAGRGDASVLTRKIMDDRLCRRSTASFRHQSTVEALLPKAVEVLLLRRGTDGGGRG